MLNLLIRLVCIAIGVVLIIAAPKLVHVGARLYPRLYPGTMLWVYVWLWRIIGLAWIISAILVF